MYLVHKLYYFNIMIELSSDSADNQKNESSENKLEEIVSEQKLRSYTEERFLYLERAVDTTKKWNLQNMFGSNLWVI